jgi:hydroxymethylglutaryl-CoA lyase
MGFGNPYGEKWNSDIVIAGVKKLVQCGIRIVALADTIGVSNPERITHLFSNLIPEFRDVEFGAHLHSNPKNWKEKIEAAVACGCKRFDTAILGIGGCPMADDKLVGNIATENLVDYFGGPQLLGLNGMAYQDSIRIAGEIFHS